MLTVILVFTITLYGCGTSNGTNPTPTSRPTPTPAATPLPTAASTQAPTSTPTTTPTPTPIPAYVGQWDGIGEGSMIWNFRADQTLSLASWGGGTIGDRSNLYFATKGTYTFTPTTPGDDTSGTLHIQYTHQYNLGTNTWESYNISWDFVFVMNTGVSPHTLTQSTTEGDITYRYYGPAVTIPDTY